MKEQQPFLLNIQQFQVVRPREIWIYNTGTCFQMLQKEFQKIIRKHYSSIKKLVALDLKEETLILGSPNYSTTSKSIVEMYFYFSSRLSVCIFFSNKMLLFSMPNKNFEEREWGRKNFKNCYFTYMCRNAFYYPNIYAL